MKLFFPFKRECESDVESLSKPVKGGMYKIQEDIQFILEGVSLPDYTWQFCSITNNEVQTIITVNKGFIYDGATGAIDKGLFCFSLIHDVCCLAHNATRVISYRRVADRFSYKLMRKQGVSWWRAWVVSRSIKKYALVKYGIR